MNYLLPLLFILVGCASKKTDADRLGKYISTEPVTTQCIEKHKERCITGKQTYEHGHVLTRRNGAVAAVVND